MTNLDDSSFQSFYQYPRWSKQKPIRPQSSLPAKNATDMFKLGIENRNLIETSSSKRLITHNIYIPTGIRVHSPPPLYQPAPTPDFGSTIDHASTHSSATPIPIRLKSAPLTIPAKTNLREKFSKNFPSQFHEKRKLTEKRKQQKQQTKTNAPDDPETWLHLRQSLAELKRLATTEQILFDPSTSLFNCDGFSFEALKQVIQQQQQQQQINRLKSDSGLTSSTDTMRSYHFRPQTSASTSRKSPSRPRSSAQTPTLTQVYPHSTFDPFIVSAKPLHPLLLTGNNRPFRFKPRQNKISSSLSAPSALQAHPLSSLDDKRYELTLSDLSNSFTPSPTLQNLKDDQQQENEPIVSQQQQSSSSPMLTDLKRPSSTLSLKSTIKLKPQVPRCRSANEVKQFYLKLAPRFILITDQEHRIESWYHQYPFINSDDLIKTFQSKTNHFTVPAYFIEEQRAHFKQKTYLQGKPFQIQNDWKKYDLILISNNIYQQIIGYLQTFLKLSGTTIQICQINHNDDLKSQVRLIHKQFQQQQAISANV